MRPFAILGALLAVAPGLSAQAGFRGIKPIGVFSNVRPAQQRSLGYSLELWRVDTSIGGLFAVYTGQKGDPPLTALDNVKYDHKTGALSFKLKMVTGCIVRPGGKLEPGRESFEFKGVLGDDAVKGKISRGDLEHPERTPEVQEVELGRRPDAPSVNAESHYDWKAKIDDLIAEREPRCRGSLAEPKKKR